MKLLRWSVTWYVVGYLMVVAAFGWGFHQISYQANYRAWQLCENSNAARRAIKDAIEANTEALITAATKGPSAKQLTPAEKRQQEAGIAFYRNTVSSKLAQIKISRCPRRP